MVKTFGSKKLWQKGCCKGLVKKALVNVDLHCQSPIINYITIKQSRTKQFQTSMNIIK